MISIKLNGKELEHVKELVMKPGEITIKQSLTDRETGGILYGQKVTKINYEFYEKDNIEINIEIKSGTIREQIENEMDLDKTTQDKLNKFNKELLTRVRGNVTLDSLIEHLEMCMKGYSEPVRAYRGLKGKLVEKYNK